MDKRSFLKLSAAALASRAFSPLFARASEEPLHNWAGNIVYSTEQLESASTIAEAVALVKSHPKLKVLGTRHSFNRLPDSRDDFVSVRPLDAILALHPESRSVTIGGGATYGHIAPLLDAKGFALHNLASLPDITAAGAASTATHGSGEKNGNLSTAVVALEFIAADGSIVTLSRQSDGGKFPGAVVSLGALGVITQLTLAIEPTYKVRQYVYENLPFAALAANFDAIEASAYSVSLFTDWSRGVNEVWLKCRDDAEKPFAAPPEFFGATRAKRNLHPIAALSSENCTEQMGVPGPWYDRLPHFRIGRTPSAGKELQTEYFVPRKHAVEAILAVQRLTSQVTPHLLITEIRTVAADDFWLSPAYHRDSVTIHFTWKPEWPEVSRLLPVIEKELAPFHPRPHWAKLFAMPPASFLPTYERLDDFRALAKLYDPSGKFRNEFLNTNVFGA